MVNLIIPTDEQTFAALKRLAEAKQVSIEELTYQLLTNYVEQHPYSEESWPSVGLFASGVKDTGRNAEEILHQSTRD